MSQKAKKHGAILPSEIHVILAEPPEYVLERFKRIREKQVRVATDVTEDGIGLFLLQYMHGNQVTAEARGRLMRWQGTDTRLDCDGHIRSTGLWASMGSFTLTSALLVAGWSLAAMVFTRSCLFVTDWNAYNSWLLPLVLLAIGGSIVAFSRLEYFGELFARREYNDRRDMDHLMSIVVDTITGDQPIRRSVEMDVDTSMWLDEAFSGRVLVGDDGELIYGDRDRSNQRGRA